MCVPRARNGALPRAHALVKTLYLTRGGYEVPARSSFNQMRIIVSLSIFAVLGLMTNAVPAHASGGSAGVDLCQLPTGDKCIQEVKGRSVAVPGRPGAALVFACTIVVYGDDLPSLLSTSITECKATSLGSGPVEEITAPPNGTQTATSSTAGASTTGKDAVYEVCVQAHANYILETVPLPRFCTTVHLSDDVDPGGGR